MLNSRDASSRCDTSLVFRSVTEACETVVGFADEVDTSTFGLESLLARWNALLDSYRLSSIQPLNRLLLFHPHFTLWHRNHF